MTNYLGELNDSNILEENLIDSISPFWYGKEKHQINEEISKICFLLDNNEDLIGYHERVNKISNEYNKKEKNNQKENTLSINQRKLLLEGKIREKVNVLKDRYEALEAQNESFHENNTSVENKDKFNQNLESMRKINEIIEHLKNWIEEVKDPNISNERLNELEKKFNDLKNSSANITNVNNNIINSTNEIEKSLLYE